MERLGSVSTESSDASELSRKMAQGTLRIRTIYITRTENHGDQEGALHDSLVACDPG